VLGLSTGLTAHGWEVEVATAEGSAIAPALAEAGIPMHELPLVRPLGSDDVRATRRLRALDRRGRYSIVHAHSSKAGGLVRAALPHRRRLVYTPHCMAFAMTDGGLFRIAYWAFEQALVPRTVALVAVSEWERADMARKLAGARSRLRLIPNGVSPCPDGAPDRELSEFKGDGRLAGFVGVLRPQKDPLALVRAAAHLSDDGKVPIRIAIVGNGPLAPAVDAEIVRLRLADRVRHFPFRGDMARYLNALSLFVLPSRWEAFPIAVLESMSCGVPALANDVGGAAEIVLDGVTGRLVRPGPPEKLAAAIRDLLGEPGRLEQMGAAGRALVRDRFNIELTVKNVSALYDQLISLA